MASKSQSSPIILKIGFKAEKFLPTNNKPKLSIVNIWGFTRLSSTFITKTCETKMPMLLFRKYVAGK